MGMLKKVSLSVIKNNPVALRGVNKESEEYMGLVDSIRQKGFLGAITVRQKKDETGEYFEVLDGLHRTEASRDAGLAEINVDIVEMTDAAALEAQIMANVHKIETKPVEYSKQLVKILMANPLWTESELATRLGKSAAWIKERLGLVKIANPQIVQLIDEGKINLSNAYALAKLPANEMAEYVDRAMTQGADEFVPAVNARVKEIKDNRLKGKDAAPQEFVAVAHLQSVKDIKDESERLEIMKSLFAQFNISKPLDAARLALQWTLHLDPMSVQVAKAKDDERKAKREEALKAKQIEREEKKAKNAEEKAAEAAKAAAEARAALSGKK